MSGETSRILMLLLVKKGKSDSERLIQRDREIETKREKEETYLTVTYKMSGETVRILMAFISEGG